MPSVPQLKLEWPEPRCGLVLPQHGHYSAPYLDCQTGKGPGLLDEGTLLGQVNAPVFEDRRSVSCSGSLDVTRLESSQTPECAN
jgi:hypothetical protein